MTLLYIVRHGETDWNKDGRYQGQTDIPLNAEGRRQGAAVGARLASVPLDSVYSSDLMRAHDTARALAGGRPIVLDLRLREMHAGRCQGLLHTEIAEREPAFWEAARQDPDNTPFPDGESPLQLQSRAMECLKAIAERHPDGRVAVVTHGGVIKTMVAGVLGVPLTVRPRFWMDNCSLTIVEAVAKGWRLRTLNDTAHLEQAPAEVKADF
jgi:broad specificity phosphatase PhoE